MNQSNEQMKYDPKVQGCPRGVKVKALDCGIVVREFVLQSSYYVHFRERYESPYPPSYGLNSSRRMALALNNLKRVDMPLNKETKPKVKHS